MKFRTNLAFLARCNIFYRITFRNSTFQSRDCFEIFFLQKQKFNKKMLCCELIKTWKSDGVSSSSSTPKCRVPPTPTHTQCTSQDQITLFTLLWTERQRNRLRLILLNGAPITVKERKKTVKKTSKNVNKKAFFYIQNETFCHQDFRLSGSFFFTFSVFETKRMYQDPFFVRKLHMKNYCIKYSFKISGS